MKLEVLRYCSRSEFTLGGLFDVTSNKEFLCFTLEDEYRKEKVYGKTRIPAGEYEIELLTDGSYHGKYLKRFSEFHKGMLWVKDVPGFEGILIHTGVTHEHTSGCLILGNAINAMTGNISYSTDAYKRIYSHVLPSLLEGNRVTINYVDFDYAEGMAFL